jgi:hypothetical protein
MYPFLARGRKRNELPCQGTEKLCQKTRDALLLPTKESKKSGEWRGGKGNPARG